MTKPPPTRMSVKVIKQSPYKGGLKEWSNRWYFSPTGPMDLTTFEDLSDWLVGIEHNYLGTPCTIIGTTGYNPGSEVPVHTKTYSTACTATLAGSQSFATLEVASLWRFTTDQRSVKNHPIYGFKYYHQQILDTLPDREAMPPPHQASQQTDANLILAGNVVGGTTYFPCTAYGAVFQQAFVEPMYTHRDFPA